MATTCPKNHGITLYPHWCNASDFKDTNESFDTVALHSSDLHQALENRCDQINWKRIKLSLEQKAISRAQGVRLSMLLFATLKEKSLFTKHYSIISKKTETELAIWWCQFVDGINVFPKLPVHFRMHLKTWLKINRIENAIRAAKKGADKLKEINDKLSPFYSTALPSPSATLASASSTIGLTLSSTNTTNLARPTAFPAIFRPPIMPQPVQKAIHNKPFIIVGSTMIGVNPGG